MFLEHHAGEYRLASSRGAYTVHHIPYTMCPLRWGYTFTTITITITALTSYGKILILIRAPVTRILPLPFRPYRPRFHLEGTYLLPRHRP